MALLFTCGDPLSINIEAFLRVVVPGMARHRSVIGIGSHWQLVHQASALGLPLPPFESIQALDQVDGPGIYWMDPFSEAQQIDAREMSEIERGRIAKAALDAVPEHSKEPLAVLTAPINKKTISLAGFKYPGQTEFFENLWNSKAVMMLAGTELRVALATNHMPLSLVPKAITAELVFRKIMIIHETSKKMFGMSSPRIAVCGLNPHCGDGGLFGNEDMDLIAPAIAKASALGVAVSGPFPADTIFFRACKGDFDVVLAMYHDQGLGPLKTVHFDDAVNISMGLPHLRVSPDHGPASDLYLTGRASIKSFDAAAKVCERWLTEQKG
jgi:4-hydroxythreonine-4-phosphate dehydrogenase